MRSFFLILSTIITTSPGSDKLSVSPYNFGAYLLPPPMVAAAVGGDKLRRGTIYISKPMRVVQKVQGGYLITNPEQTGVAFVKTKKELNPDLNVCFVLTYDGDYSYIGIDGFAKKIPSMRPYSGKHFSTACDEFPGIGQSLN